MALATEQFAPLIDTVGPLDQDCKASVRFKLPGQLGNNRGGRTSVKPVSTAKSTNRGRTGRSLGETGVHGETSLPLLLATFLSLPKPERHLRFLDTKEAASHAGVSRRTVQRWIDEGKVDAVRIGHRLWVDLTSLVRFLNEYQP